MAFENAGLENKRGQIRRDYDKRDKNKRVKMQRVFYMTRKNRPRRPRHAAARARYAEHRTNPARSAA